MPRKLYLEKIRPYIGKPIIKVLTGQRRVGKTFILRQINEIIREMDNEANIVFIDKEKKAFQFIKTSEDLYGFVSQNLMKESRNYIFLDEIQEIKEFEIALRQLMSEDLDIYCTGSNAKMLSGDLATYLSGRYIEFHINSLSFNEFTEAHELNPDNDALSKYIRYGGMPYLIHMPLEDEIVYGYLRSIFNTIVLKDIVARYNIRDIDFLERLVEYLADNLGSYVSAKKISDYLKSQRVSLSVNTVMNYLSYLSNAFFISKVQRYDIIGRRRFEINDKYYFSDLGLMHSVLPYTGAHINSVFENLVYNQLVIDGYAVQVGKHQDREIDFVASKEGDIRYIQVAYQIPDEKVHKREFGNLLKIEDNFQKLVISSDEFASDYKGIRHMHILDFLSNSVTG